MVERAVDGLGVYVCGRRTYDHSLPWWGADGASGPAVASIGTTGGGNARTLCPMETCCAYNPRSAPPPINELQRSKPMAKVIAIMSMSLDGHVADTADGVAEVFAWYTAGAVDVPTTKSDTTFHVSPPSAAHLRALMSEVGAMLTGRRTFETADGWGGQHSWGIPAFVVTHRVPDGWPRPGSDVHFVTEGLESAVAQAKSAAGDRAVGVHGGETIRQLLDAGLLDEIHIDLAPVLLGAGVPMFDGLQHAPVTLGNPTVVAGVGVTHLRYPVRFDQRQRGHTQPGIHAAL